MRRYLTDRRSAGALLMLSSIGMGVSFSVWQALLNNFAIERAAFTGVEIGILQSLREIPGFMAFTMVFLLLLLREQRVLVLSMVLLGVCTAITGFFPSVIGLYVTTVIMSVGFHYLETARQSLTLQWVPVEKAPEFMGHLLSVYSLASLVTYGLTYAALEWAKVDMVWVYLVGGGVTALVGAVAWAFYPRFPQAVEQHKHLVLRVRYWLYYMLTFMAGARRQIFIVFAGFLMVEKFAFSASAIALMFLANGAVNMVAAPAIGRLIARWGERNALAFEYVGLITVFSGYAIVDNLFFTMAIAMRSYFHKIADLADIASTSGVAFTINHIAAIVLPAALGFLWIISPAVVFLAGFAMAVCSLVLALLSRATQLQTIRLSSPVCGRLLARLPRVR
jgi:hypothetical protein